ncbi:MAG TPA: hypothetical protein VIQ31_08245 [Phormidium sp.]
MTEPTKNKPEETKPEETKPEIKRYLVFLKRDPETSGISVRVSLKDGYLRESEHEFAAYAIEADSETNAAFKAAQTYFAPIGVGICELWVREGIHSHTDWDWNYHENILNGVEMGKREFSEFFDEYDSEVIPEEIELPLLPEPETEEES